MSSQGTKRAFTIIEMLVVMVIISMLVAILMPAIGRAQEEARRTQCKNNLRQIGMAYHMYTQEQIYFDYAPPIYEDAINPYDTVGGDLNQPNQEADNRILFYGTNDAFHVGLEEDPPVLPARRPRHVLTGLGLLLEYMGGQERAGMLFCPSATGRYMGGSPNDRSAARDSYPPLTMDEGTVLFRNLMALPDDLVPADTPSADGDYFPDSPDLPYPSPVPSAEYPSEVHCGYLYRGYDEVVLQTGDGVWQTRPQRAIDFGQTNDDESRGRPATRMVAMDYCYKETWTEDAWEEGRPAEDEEVTMIRSNHDNEYVNILYADGHVEGFLNTERPGTSAESAVEWSRILTIEVITGMDDSDTYPEALDYVIRQADQIGE